MEKNKRENNILVYLVREKNGKENWGPKVFFPDPPNCNLPNLKSKWSGKKNPTWRYQIPCATNVHSHFVQKIFSRLFLLTCPILCVCVHFSPIFPFICCFFFQSFFFSLIYFRFLYSLSLNEVHSIKKKKKYNLLLFISNRSMNINLYKLYFLFYYFSSQSN